MSYILPFMIPCPLKLWIWLFQHFLLHRLKQCRPDGDISNSNMFLHRTMCVNSALTTLTQHGNNWPCYFLCRLFPLHRTQISRDLLCRPRKELFCIVRIRRSAPDRCLGKFRLWADEWGWFPARSSRWAPSAWVGWRRIRRSRRTCHRDTRTCCGWCTRQSGTSRSPFYIIFGVTG